MTALKAGDRRTIEHQEQLHDLIVKKYLYYNVEYRDLVNMVISFIFLAALHAIEYF
jgi:hypothetical protein